MRSELFEEAWKQNRHLLESPKCLAQAMYLAGEQHQQSKVDELNQELHLVLNNWNDLTNAVHARTNGTAVAEARQLYEKVDELQKRVDKAIAILSSKKKMYVDMVIEIEQALKGGE